MGFRTFFAILNFHKNAARGALPQLPHVERLNKNCYKTYQGYHILIIALDVCYHQITDITRRRGLHAINNDDSFNLD